MDRWSAASRSTIRAASRSAVCLPARTSFASSRSTTPTRTASSAARPASGSISASCSSSTALASATGLEARIGVRVLRRLEAEVVGSYATPSLVIQTSADSESASGVAAKERLRQFTIHGAAVWYVPTRRAGARTAPFVTAGVGYLRHVHENDVLLVGGTVYEAGAGIKQLLVSRDRRRLKGVGVRADVRAVARAKGVAPDGGTHVSPAVTASLFVRF